jgi:hypothetical protein
MNDTAPRKNLLTHRFGVFAQPIHQASGFGLLDRGGEVTQVREKNSGVSNCGWGRRPCKKGMTLRPDMLRNFWRDVLEKAASTIGVDADSCANSG